MNSIEFRCPWIEREVLWERADKFRSEYWISESLPVDTEQIVELRLKLDIEPVHNLQSEIDMDAYLKMDLSGIVVDYDSYMNIKYANRMRFSFAHEIGHFVLHKNTYKDIYNKLKISTPEEWKNFTMTMPETEYRNFEWQANEFAGRFLVPYKRLQVAIEKTYEMLKTDNNLINYLTKDPDAVLSRVSPQLCKPFGVSETVIETRVKREGLWPPPFNLSV